jgi:hypothetical protein
MKRFDSQLRSRPGVILNALTSIARKHDKKYCWVSQEKLRELVGKFGGIWMSPRTLNRDLRFLEDEGWIERIRRNKKGPGNQILFACTLYKFGVKVFNSMFCLGNSVKRFFNHYRLPRWAEYQLHQKQAFSLAPASSVEKVWIKDKDGSVLAYNPFTGDLKSREGLKDGQ